jgi:hypothetical protein
MEVIEKPMSENVEPLGLVAIQVFSPDNPRLLSSAEDRNGLAEDVRNLWIVRWLPPAGKELPPQTAGASESSIILLYLLGISFFSLAKPLLEETAKEAGKDLWLGIKRLVSKLHKRQCADSYHLYSKIYLVLDLRDEFVAIQFRVEGAADETTEAEIEAEIASQILELGSSWENIHAVIEKWKVGDKTKGSIRHGGPTTIHLIRRHGDKKELMWSIEGVESVKFFENLRPKPERESVRATARKTGLSRTEDGGKERTKSIDEFSLV